jgi:uncharacterized protein (TIGR02001 family)
MCTHGAQIDFICTLVVRALIFVRPQQFLRPETGSPAAQINLARLSLLTDATVRVNALYLRSLFMKKTILAVSVAALLPMATSTVHASEPALSISGNVSLVSDYRFRGISQTDKSPALQGGFDLEHASGFYLGTWGSNVSQWANADGSMELDFYGGYGGEFAGGIGYDIGFTRYYYPKNTGGNNTSEWHVGLSYGPLSYQFSKTTTNWFGVADSKGSYYHSLALEFEPIEKLTLSATAGKQIISGAKKRAGDSDYGVTGKVGFTDYSLGASYDLGDGFSLGLTFTKVSFDKKADGEVWFTGADSKDTKLFKNATVLSLTKEF